MDHGVLINVKFFKSLAYISQVKYYACNSKLPFNDTGDPEVVVLFQENFTNETGFFNYYSVFDATIGTAGS